MCKGFHGCNDTGMEITQHVQLTPAGLAWAASHPESITARVAVAGDDWPLEHRRAAVEACNEAGE